MLIRIVLSLLLILSAQSAFAQSAGASKAKTKKVKKARKSATQLRLGMGLWQETIDLNTSFAESKMVAQSMGFLTNIARNVPFRNSRWAFNYSLDAGVGTIKGKGNNDNVPDELKNQLWLLAGVSAGFMYRTSPSAEIGFTFPAYYRAINWELQKDSDFDAERDSSFSVGAGGVYVARLNKSSAINLAVTHQYLWDATMWTAFWQYEYR